jgi:hypothetical protein
MNKFSFFYPNIPEQTKIASFLTAVDDKLQTLKKKKQLLEQYKKGVMQKIFSQEIRFKDDNGNEFAEWEVKKLGEVANKKSSNISANKIEDNFGDYIIYGASGILKKVDFYKEEDDYISIIKDGAGVGEGIVIKNYDFVNKYGRVTWAKLVTNEFKEAHHKEMGAPLIGGEIVEEKIVTKLVTQSLVDKVVAKIINEQGGWSSKNIPQLINTVFYDLIREDAWTMVKEFKNPTINFKTLSHYTTAKVKELRKDLF